MISLRFKDSNQCGSSHGKNKVKGFQSPEVNACGQEALESMSRMGISDRIKAQRKAEAAPGQADLLGHPEPAADEI